MQTAVISAFPFVRRSSRLNTYPVKMNPASPDCSAHSRRPGVPSLLAVLILAAVVSCFLLHRAVEFGISNGANFFPIFDDGELLYSVSLIFVDLLNLVFCYFNSLIPPSFIFLFRVVELIEGEVVSELQCRD